MPTTSGSHQGIYRIAQREKLCAKIPGEDSSVILSYFFFSLTMDINRASKNPLVPVAKPDRFYSCSWVRVHYILLLAIAESVNHFSSPVNG